jgi:hypothetical protein
MPSFIAYRHTHVLGMLFAIDPPRDSTVSHAMITDDFGDLVPLGWSGLAAHINDAEH